MNTKDRYADIFDEPIDEQLARNIIEFEAVYNSAEPPAQLSWPRFQLLARQRNAQKISSQSSRTPTSVWPRWIQRVIAHLFPHAYAVDREAFALLEEPPFPLEENAPVEDRLLERRVSPRRPWLRTLERGLAALLVLGIVLGWLAISYLHRSTTSSPALFSDASARSLGAPVFTARGNFSTIYEWSPDGRTFAFLQVDSQKHTMEVHLLDIASGRSTSYPVLDSSWMPAFNLYDPVEILMGRYLVAMHAQGSNQATLVIWDIIGQHAITRQTIPAQIGRGGQVLFPWIAPSSDEQKFAIDTPDGTVTILDVASGQKLITCKGKFPLALPSFPRLQWYSHDQSLLLSADGAHARGLLVAWDVATGTRLFSMNDANKVYAPPVVSPDDRYLALSTGPQPVGGAYRVDSLEILDAHSGKVLRTYHLAGAGSWLPDSQRMLVMNSDSTGAIQKMQVRVWNVFTNQVTFEHSWSYAGTIWSIQTTPGGQYLIVGGAGNTLEIWQLSTGRHVATIATPGTPARTDAFFYTNNRQIVIGQRGNFDIWNIATGKLRYKYHGTTPFSIPGVNGSIVLWSPDGEYLAMLAGKGPSIGDGMVSIWRIPGA